MKRITWASLGPRGRRWLLGTAALLGAYTLAGFWLLPAVLQDQIPKLAQSALGRPASVGAVRFNPYTLRLELKDLALNERDGTPLATLGALTLDLEWSSLPRRAWTLAEVRLSAPSVHLRLDRQGRLNLAQLGAGPGEAPQAAPAPFALPRLIVGQLVLEQGRLDWRDEQAGYRNQLAPIDLTLAGFSTLPEHSGDYSLRAVSAHGGTLRWNGTLSLAPIRGSGELTLEQLSLPELAVYLPREAGVRLQSGRLSATLPYRFAYTAGRFEASLEQARLALLQPGLQLGTLGTPLQLAASQATLQLRLDAAHAAGGTHLKLSQAALALSDLALGSGGQTPVRLARLGLQDGSLDLAARRVRVGRVEAADGQLQLTRDRQGQLNLQRLLPRFPERKQQTAGAPWTVSVDQVLVQRLGAELQDQGTGLGLHVQDAALTLENASTDLAQALRFDASLAVREGGRLTARGSLVPAGLVLQSELSVQQLALAPLQPLLDQHLKLRIAGGSVAAQGQLTRGQPGQQRAAALRYVGSLHVHGLALTEDNGDLFAGWTSLGSQRLTATLQPNRLSIPELRIVEPNAKLHIDADRSFNAGKLRVRPASTPQDSAPAAEAPAQEAPPAAASAEPAAETFAVRIQRVRMVRGKLDFADLSLLPPFAAKIHELDGMVNGLSSQADARSQIELDGRVDAYGLARVRGELTPFAPGRDTRVQAVFQNVDMVPTSPYTAKFVGYKLADGKISLDLEYQVRDGQLDGSNQIVVDRLTLGERVDSPDAVKLPVELAIALLKDSEDRIDIALPVTGNTKDPQFSYGGLIWQALGQFVGKVVTSPFRALGRALGIGGEELEAVQFDPGSARLLPPEREKLKQVAQILAQRRQLKLTVPAHYHEAADGAALRQRAVRLAVAQRAEVQLDAGEEPGPPNLGDRAVRQALRALYAERFGVEALAQRKQAAEQAAPADAKVSLMQRMNRMTQGEPVVADLRPFYDQLQQRLEQAEPLAPEALAALGTARARAILDALQAEGVDAQSAAAAAPEGIGAEAGARVPLKLGLATK